jgi:N-glycosylase/DNA lyase
MHKLAQSFSPELLTLDRPYHLFPAPHQFPPKLEPILREMGFGYRAAFLSSTIETLRTTFGSEPGDIERGLDSWRHGNIEETRLRLMELKGVGRKVADCVMLMSLDQVSCCRIH